MAGDGSRHREFLDRMQRTVDEAKLSLMTDAQSFTRLLDQAVIEYTRRLKQL